MKTEYVVTSKPGMTPYSVVSSKSQARTDSRAARKLGLDGEIVAYTNERKLALALHDYSRDDGRQGHYLGRC